MQSIIVNYRSNIVNKEEYNLYKKILINISPVCEKIMNASIISINNKKDIEIWDNISSKIIDCYRINVEVMHKTDNNIILFFYDHDRLKSLLNNASVLKFLDNIGYKNISSVDDILNVLKQKYKINDFPHEIGIFLGYPLNDVFGFIENNGKGFKACKYWKVYDDVDYANNIFNKIDLLRKNIFNNIKVV